MEPAMIRRFRHIPVTARVLVAEGDHVMPDTPVARVDVLPGKLWRIDVARELCDEPSDVPALMLKHPGQRVAAGDVIASGGDFFERRAARSPASGAIALVSRHLGFAYVREDVEVGSDEGPVTVQVTKTLRRPAWQVMTLKSANANVGAIAVKGQVIASRKSEDWRETLTVKSPIYGKITGISPLEGTITIAPIFKSPLTPAYLKGTVSRVTSQGVEVSARAAVIPGIWGLGAESWGPIQVLDGDLTVDSAISEGAVVVARGTATYDGLMLAQEKRAMGAVLGYLSSETVVRFCGGARNMGITGDEDVPFPVILTQGFLPAEMNSEAFSAFLRAEGRVCSLTGVTHIRAGVIRPEAIVYE